MRSIGKGTSFVSESDWRNIEEQSAFKVDAATRAKINHIMSDYAMRGPTASVALSSLALKKKVGKWAVRTDRLRAQIANKPKGAQRKKDYLPEKLDRRRAQEASERVSKNAERLFLSIDESSVSFSTDHLAQALRDMTTLVDAMAVYIGRCAPKPTPKMQWWLVWITLIILLLRKNGYSVSWRKGKKKGVRKEFVHFVALLQKHLPPDCVPRKSYESIQKGIVLAIPLTRGKPVTELRTILKRWGAGEFDLLSKARAFGMRNPHMFMVARVLERVEAQVT